MFYNLAFTPMAHDPSSHQSHKCPLQFKGCFSIFIITASLCSLRSQTIPSLELSPSGASAVFLMSVTQWFYKSKMSYLLHSVVKAIVIPAMYFPHYEIYFNIFNIATVIVSERDSEHKNNSLVQKG